jgi:hypothetical protein
MNPIVEGLLWGLGLAVAAVVLIPYPVPGGGTEWHPARFWRWLRRKVK